MRHLGMEVCQPPRAAFLSEENMPITSRQIIARSVPAIAGLKLLNVTNHYWVEDEVQYPASEGLDIEAGLRALVPSIGTGIEAAGLTGEGSGSGVGTY
jgi:hypothetical protein